MISLDTGLWQRGPSSSFNPLSLSPLAWWDWSDSSQLYTDSGLTTLVSADGDPIGGIKDKSGSNYHLTQTDPTKKWLYKTNIQNGKSVGRPDGVNDYLEVAASTSYFKCLHYGGATVFFAGKAGNVTNATAEYGVISNAAGSGADTGFLFEYYQDASNPSQPNVIIKQSGVGAAVSSYNVAAFRSQFPSNTPLLATLKIDPTNATAASRLSFYKGSGSAVTGNASTGAPGNINAGRNLTLGCYVTGASTINGFNNGDFYEILIYPTLLSDANRVLVRDYLMTKWGV